MIGLVLSLIQLLIKLLPFIFAYFGVSYLFVVLPKMLSYISAINVIIIIAMHLIMLVGMYLVFKRKPLFSLILYISAIFGFLSIVPRSTISMNYARYLADPLLTFFPQFAVCLTFVGLAMLFRLIDKGRFATKKSKNKSITSDKQFKDEKPQYTFNATQPIHLYNIYRGILIEGGAGSGKTRTFFEPIIRQSAELNLCGIVYDFKGGELSNKALYSYQNSTIKTHYVDFVTPKARVNPIHPDYMKNGIFCLEYAKTLIYNLNPKTIKDCDFWHTSAIQLLAAVMLYLKKHYPHYCTLPHAISLILHTNIEDLFVKFKDDNEVSGLVRSIISAQEQGAKEQIAGVLGTLQSLLANLNSPEIFYTLSGNDVDLYLNNPLNPQLLCINNSYTAQSSISPLISLIINVATKQMNTPNNNPSMLLLDELPTIYIPNLEQIPATGRSNKIATIIGIQDQAQLIDKYGKDKANVIISNLGTQFVGRTTSIETAKRTIELFGKFDKSFETASRNTGTSGKGIELGSNTGTGTSETIQERTRITIQDLTALNEGQFCGVLAESNYSDILPQQFANEPIENSSYTYPDSTLDYNAIYNEIIRQSKEISTFV